MQETPYLLGFTAGELSPWLSCRFDLQAYQRGAALMKNFLVQPYGGVKRRRGSVLVSEARSTEAIRLFSFRYDEADVLLLEFSPGAVRFFKDGALVTRDEEPYVLETPWTTADQVLSLQFVQVNDVVYVTAPGVAPMVMKRYSNTNWSIGEFSMNPFPRETYVAQSIPLRVNLFPSYMARLECDSDIFEQGMEGREYVLADCPVPTKTLFLNKAISINSTAMPNLETATSSVVGKIYHEHDEATNMYRYYTCYRVYNCEHYNGSKSAADYGSFFYAGAWILPDGFPYEVCGEWELRTTGTWDALWEIWRSFDTYTEIGNFYNWNWTRIKSFSQTSYSTRENWALSGSEERPCRFILVCKASKTTSISAMMYLQLLGGRREYKFKIKRVTDSRTAMAQCLSYYGAATENFSTTHWSFGACGYRNGYPGFVGFHQGRLWFGGMANLPTTLIASAVGDFGNFYVDSTDDSALHLTLATSDQSRICWICPARSLLVGTSVSEWTLASPDGGGVTPSNATFSRQSSVGSENMPAYGVENTVFYVQRGGKRLREISYKLEADGFTSTDTSLLAEHLFAPGISEWVVQRGTNTHLWVLMADGTLAVLTTNIEQQVTAWQRVVFEGRRVLHLAALPMTGSNEDEVWLVIRNESNGVTTLERLGQEECYLDGFCRGALAPAPHLAGLPGFAYPEGCPGQALAVQFGEDGSFEPPEGMDASGTWCYGAAVLSELRTMPMERETSFNTIRQEGRVRLRLLESNPAFHYRAAHVERWERFDPAAEGLPSTYTGSVRISHIPSPGVGQGFELRVDGTLPFQLLAMTIEFDYHSH